MPRPNRQCKKQARRSTPPYVGIRSCGVKRRLRRLASVDSATADGSCTAGAVSAPAPVYVPPSTRSTVHGLTEEDRRAQNRCCEHGGEVQRFYCETCEELICCDCTVMKHREHHFVDYKEAADQGKGVGLLNEIFPDLHKVMNMMKELSHSIASTSQVRQEFRKNVRRTKTKVQEAAAEVTARVKAEEKQLLAVIEKLEESRGQTFDENDKTANDMLQIIRHSVETAEGLTETPSDWKWNFLLVNQMLKKDLESQTSSHDIPKTDQGLSCLKLSQKSQLVDDLDLGKLVVEDTKWELGLEFGKDLTNEKMYMYAYDGICFLEHDKIAATDYLGNQVIRFNDKGEKEGVIRMEECIRPYQIASMNGQLIVTDDTDDTDYVKVYNKDNTQAFQFTTNKGRNASVLLRGVVMNKNRIIVGDCRNAELTEHDPDDGFLIRTIPVNIGPQFLAADSNGRVVISSSGHHEPVHVVDTKGAIGVTLFTITPTIKDQQLKYCRGLCCDGTDIYVAVVANDNESTGHIHRYDGDGRFLSCVVSGLYDPMGIALSPMRDRMAVTNDFSLKIFHKV